MPAGRPSAYNKKIADEICERISQGETLLQICRDKHMPCRFTVHKWLLDSEKHYFVDNYARAKDMQADYFFEELLDIAEDGSNDWIEREVESGRKATVPDHEHINRSRLRIDTKKWYLSKVLPKKYGDKHEVVHSGEVDHKHTVEVVDLDERIGLLTGDRICSALN